MVFWAALSVFPQPARAQTSATNSVMKALEGAQERSVQTMTAPLDAVEAYPPEKPRIYLRSEWIRPEWGCTYPSKGLDDDTVKRTAIAVHHTADAVMDEQLKMTEEQALQEVKLLLCDMRDAHMSGGNTDGVAWDDIGYHYLIDWRGKIWQGRPFQKKGAHVGVRNPGTVGVSLLGNFELDNEHPTAMQLSALKGLLAHLVYSYKIPPTAIHGHHKYKELRRVVKKNGRVVRDGNRNPVMVVSPGTDCPGKNLERYNEHKTPYVAATASPLRRIRMSLLGLWERMQNPTKIKVARVNASPKLEDILRPRRLGFDSR